MPLERARNIADLRLLAQVKLPRMVFDYIDGGAEDEITLARNVDRLREHTLHWSVLKDISAIDTSTTIMGADSALPFFITPTAASRLFHYQGEMAVARAATKAKTIYSMSTIGSTRVEDVATVAPGPKWFQVYVWKDRGLVREGLARAKAAGFSALALTVDVPVAGNRERDPKNRFTIPPKISMTTALDVLSRPTWAYRLATSPRIRPANFDGVGGDHPGGIMGFIDSQFDRTVTWKDAAWLIEEWNGPVAIKGVMSASDARECLAIGAAGVWVSNHGGRQLDRVSATIDALPEVVDAVGGRASVVFDGGVRRGTDVLTALALGADGVAIGRAYLYGLGAGGEAGVTKALQILETELRRDMALLGVTRIAEITRGMVSRPR
ncbi:MAG: alpha-hydroxy-acid oxidizing protein [Hyphomonadaceae bacterium]|nr:alpha-hydroxy-acid oxidizing protein [Hyphomonadaceae bacterium]